MLRSARVLNWDSPNIFFCVASVSKLALLTAEHDISIITEANSGRHKGRGKEMLPDILFNFEFRFCTNPCHSISVNAIQKYESI